MNVSTDTVILTIDDEPVIRKTIQALLEDFDYTVLTAENGRVGLEIIGSQPVDLVLVDLRMPEVDGLEVLARVRETHPDLPVIVVSGTGKIQDVVEALRNGAWDYLLKPISDFSILFHAIETCLERSRLRRENRRHQDNLQVLVEQKTRELSQVNKRLKGVVESTKKLLGSGVLEKSGPMLLNEFGFHMNAEGGSIYKVGRQGLELIASLDQGHAPPMIHFPLHGSSVFSRVIESGEPLFLEDISGDPTLNSSGWEKYRDNSLLCFPMKDAAGDVLAIIALHSKKNPPFIAQDLDIGEILASYASESLQVAKVSTALKESEERLRQAQKVEAIGTLAGGIAHDFNNILAAIIGYTDLSLFSGYCDDVVRKNLEQVKKASNRAKELVAQILAFSRMEEFSESAVDIAPIMKEALKLLRATIPSSIVIETDIPEGLGRVSTDPTKIYQVLMNLCTNGVHAMGSREGRLSIRFGRVGEGEEPREIQATGSRNWLVLSVADTGCGIAADEMDRIFDPYYTTKEKGEGTGLGLAMVQGIVRASGGVITVTSEPGKGSTFFVYFPCDDGGRGQMEEVPLAKMKGGRESILFVDDESTLGDVAGEMLKKLGYSVTVLASSRAALEVFSHNARGFDLLITDQTMPEISGMDLARAVLAVRGDLPVILYTGYSATIDGEEAKRIGIREFLMKPLSMTVLADVVRRVLDSAIQPS